MCDEEYYSNEASSMNLELQRIGMERDELAEALKAFEAVDNFEGWHPNYAEAIAKAKVALAKLTP
jgi:hypothetical protein